MTAEPVLPPAGPPERLLDKDQRGATVAALLELQQPDGMVPQFRGGPADPWNHLEVAMALAAAGEHRAAARGLGWLAAHQRPDGAWHAAYGPGGSVLDARLDTNGTAYFATGLLQLYLASGEPALLEEHLPRLRRALRFVLAQQRPSGEVCWSDAPAGSAQGFALLAACSSIYASLLAGSACAEALGQAWPELERGAERLGAAIRWRRSAFLAKDQYAMDWYYPVLAGALAGGPAQRRLAEGWDRFVRRGQGVLCRADHRWVTSAETAECALACLRAGLEGQARRLLSWTFAQRRPDGSYLTGLVYPERSEFPAGQSTSYSAAAVLLADDALAGGTSRAVLAPAGPGGGEGEEEEGAAG